MVAKIGRQYMLKIGKWPCWSKFGTIDREINIEHKQIAKYILTDDQNYHGTQHIIIFFIFFYFLWGGGGGYFAVLISNLKKSDLWAFGQNGNFSILSLFCRQLRYHSNGKS